MTTARLISSGIGIGLTDVLANGGADVLPVGWGHGGGGGVEGDQQLTFETGFVGEISLDEGLDVVAGSGILSGGDFGLKVGARLPGSSIVTCMVVASVRWVILSVIGFVCRVKLE